MEKLPLSTAGVNTLLAELYNLTDAELFLEAASVTADFRSWVNRHFLLEASQLNFLAQLDDRLVSHTGEQCRIFITQRWPITFAKESTPDDEKPRGKVFELSQSSKSSDGNPQGYQYDNTLHLSISYPLIT
ncbi:hypothetical protein [Pedobacter sp. UBA4863]|uniref:hypothetical protein n=1 Tax=Pedobacter sp. UBA4863 TaxID=1947060 RepID=UPI0025E86D74|nr:hypothetical protein [Pedobacter sp. UBA4863]